ncbi:MAG: succinate--CoA ligase subunit alpha [Spirochaetales bacterium]|nr:succinate--CoA ligase subunit alpha [Spirochaetales bacterium]
MSILLDRSTRVLIQGITGKEGTFWTRHMLDLGTRVVAGVTPGKEGESCQGVPVYHTVRRAAEHEAEASLLFVPPRYTKDAVFEALDAGIRTIVTVADGIPLHDALQIRKAALSCGAHIIGGNTSGVISPGKAMMGFFPYWIERVYKTGRLGVMTRSGSLTNEITALAVRAGFGVSTLVGVGGDPVPGCRFSEMLPLYQDDPETEGVLIIGELGGTMEEEAAEALASGVFRKPLLAFVCGVYAPEGKRMGHAGAIVTGGRGTVNGKIRALEKAGALVATRPGMLPGLLNQALGEEKTT